MRVRLPISFVARFSDSKKQKNQYKCRRNRNNYSDLWFDFLGLDLTNAYHNVRSPYIYHSLFKFAYVTFFEIDIDFNFAEYTVVRVMRAYCHLITVVTGKSGTFNVQV